MGQIIIDSRLIVLEGSGLKLILILLDFFIFFSQPVLLFAELVILVVQLIHLLRQSFASIDRITQQLFKLLYFVLPDTLPSYQPTEATLFDLIDTKLWVSFDWDKKHCLGTAEITASPVGKKRNRLVLDAKGFDIKSIVNGDGKKLTYKYDNAKLDIDLGAEIPVGKATKVKIEYVAKPDDLKVGGSAAITSDKGLYFINPDGKDKNKPRQAMPYNRNQTR